MGRSRIPFLLPLTLRGDPLLQPPTLALQLRYRC